MKRCLQIDGGGIKGIIPAIVLASIEETVGKPCHEIFDLMSGCSTGSIIAGCLAAGVPASNIRDLYLKRGAQLFTPRSRW